METIKIALSATYYKVPAVQELLRSCEMIFTSQTFNVQELQNIFGVDKISVSSIVTDSYYENVVKKYFTEKYSDVKKVEFVTRLDLIELKEKVKSELFKKNTTEGLIGYKGLENLKNFLLGMRVSADHPITGMNPTPEFVIVEVKNEDNHIYVRGQNTMWFGMGKIKNLMKFENVNYNTRDYIVKVLSDIRDIHNTASDRLGKINNQEKFRQLLRVVEITEALMDGFKLLDQNNVWSPDYKYDGDKLQQKINNTIAQLYKTLSKIN